MRLGPMLAVLGALALLAGCGGSTAPGSASKDPDGPGNNAAVYTISSSYTTVAHECTAGQTVRITGSTDIIQLVEPCGAVIADGSTNQIVIESAARLSIGGQNQHVSVKKVTSGVVQMGGSGNELVCGSRVTVNDTGSGSLTSGCGP